MLHQKLTAFRALRFSASLLPLLTQFSCGKPLRCEDFLDDWDGDGQVALYADDEAIIYFCQKFASDCDDGDPNTYLHATEFYDRKDNDCNGVVDDVVEDTGDLVDYDGDGVYSNEDCDDDNPGISPNLDENCDGVHNNCDGNIDEGVKTT